MGNSMSKRSPVEMPNMSHLAPNLSSHNHIHYMDFHHPLSFRVTRLSLFCQSFMKNEGCVLYTCLPTSSLTRLGKFSDQHIWMRERRSKRRSGNNQAWLDSAHHDRSGRISFTSFIFITWRLLIIEVTQARMDKKGTNGRTNEMDKGTTSRNEDGRDVSGNGV